MCRTRGNDTCRFVSNVSCIKSLAGLSFLSMFIDSSELAFALASRQDRPSNLLFISIINDVPPEATFILVQWKKYKFACLIVKVNNCSQLSPRLRHNCSLSMCTGSVRMTECTERERNCQMANQYRGSGDASEACSVFEHVHLIVGKRGKDLFHAWLSFHDGIVPVSVYTPNGNLRGCFSHRIHVGETRSS